MNRFCYLLLIFCITTLLGFKQDSQNAEWTIASSSITFGIKNAGFTVDGKFGPLIGTVFFDPNKSNGNLINVSVDSKSLNTGNDTRDGHLKNKEYFDVNAFPKISMKGVLFAKEKDGTFKGYYKLSLKDKTKDIVVPFNFSEKNGKGQFKGSFTINRLDYGVGESSMILSDYAKISIVLNVIKKL